MKSVLNYFYEVRAELTKVSWPKKTEVIKLTLIILSISGIVALYLGVMDFGLTKILEFIISK